MGVYINMEMPKCCAECDAEGHYENYNGDEYGFFCPFGYKAYTEETRDAKRLDNCPLVPVPPHGRMIDADANLAVMRKVLDAPYTSNGEIDTAMLRACILMFKEAPTVIEAEEGE